MDLCQEGQGPKVKDLQWDRTDREIETGITYGKIGKRHFFSINQFCVYGEMWHKEYFVVSTVLPVGTFRKRFDTIDEAKKECQKKLEKLFNLMLK